MGDLRHDDKIYRNEIKQYHRRCEQWGDRYQQDVIRGFPAIDAKELFLDVDNAFRTKPVVKGSDTTVRDHIMQTSNLWRNEMGKRFKKGLDILSYGETVGIHILICGIFNGTEISRHPCLNSFNRFGAPAIPLTQHISGIDVGEAVPNTIFTFLRGHDKLMEKLYQFFDYDRKKFFNNLSPNFIERIDLALTTLVETFGRSEVFNLEWSGYNKTLTKKEVASECINRSRRCITGSIW